MTPSSADAPARRSQTIERVRGQRNSAEPSAVTPNARYASHAAGTCRYMRRCGFLLRRVFRRAPEPEQREDGQRDERGPAEDPREPRVEQALPGSSTLPGAHVSSHSGPNASTPIAV